MSFNSTFATLMAIYQFLVAIAPLVAQIYDAVRKLFPEGTAGAVKLDTFKAMVRQLLATAEDFKKFEPIFEQAWPMLQIMVDAFHANEKARTAPAASVTQ